MDNSITIPSKTIKVKMEHAKTQEEQLKIVNYLFYTASQLTTNTPQEIICTLLSLTANYLELLQKIYYKVDVSKLMQALSAFLSSQLSNDTKQPGFIKLQNCLNEHKHFIVNV